MLDRPVVLADLPDQVDQGGDLRWGQRRTWRQPAQHPDGGGQPSGDLAGAIDTAFGGFDDFKTKVADAGVARFGSGWAWLVHDGSGLAVTSTANHAPEMYLDETAPVGFRVRDTPLGPPEAGSVEAAALAAGLEIALIDLRAAGQELSERQAPDRIRSQSAYVHTPLLQAFDGVLVVPTATIEPIVESR